MIIIVGLGNPGEKFHHTRHNAGFEALDFFAKKNDFPEFTSSKKYNSEISEYNDIFLAKPHTFMNDSGQAVKKSMSQVNCEMLIIVRDDIDLPLGTIKLSKDSGSGGHKGVDSIIKALGNNAFIQLKIGIATDDKKAEDVVLQKFSKEEQEVLHNAIEKSCQALLHIIEYGLEKAMNEYNWYHR